jgi:hypothetical protein
VAAGAVMVWADWGALSLSAVCQIFPFSIIELTGRLVKSNFAFSKYNYTKNNLTDLHKIVYNYTGKGKKYF